MNGEISFIIVDVFTRRRWTGNQLAVVLDTADLTDHEMRSIADEFGFSETAFVWPADSDASQWAMRIWTPIEEVPVAGHPVVGAAHALHQIRGAGQDLVFSIGGQAHPVEVMIDNTGIAWMAQPTATFAGTFDSTALVEAVGLSSVDLHPELPAEVVGAGHQFTVVPLASIDALKRASVDVAAFDAVIGDLPPFVYCFAEAADAWRCRLFAPHDILKGEDAASGSAAAALSYYLCRHRPGFGQAQPVRFIQGVEMGRPSEIFARFQSSELLQVGGHAVVTARGHLQR